MTPIPFRSNALRGLLGLTALLALSACASRARFEIVRPAMLDASPFGNTFSVQPFGGDTRAAYRIQTELEQRIARSLNPAIQLLAGGGGIIIGGGVLDHSYQEGMTSNPSTCYRSETYRAPNGQVATRSVPYSCMQYTRIGRAHSAVRFTVAVASTGQIVYDRMFEDTQQRSTTATNGQPAYIDGAGLLDSIVLGSVQNFARVILPWPDSVVVTFSDCGGADHCGDAFQAVRANDLFGAERLYTQILGPYAENTAQVDPDDVEIVAETLFNRGIVRSYTGSYELGMQDLQRALELQADHDDWRAELAQIETLATEQDRLRQQMQAAGQ